MRSRVIVLAALLVGLLVATSCYQGDGDFQREGIWPFAGYSLELAPFALTRGTTTHFRLRGWRSNKHTLVKLAVTAPEPIAFDELELAVAFTVKDGQGKTILALQPDLGAHLKRMQKAGDARWPENEWECRWDWGDDDVMKRAVPFIAGKAPKPQTKLECWDLLELPEHSYDIDIGCSRCPSTPALQAKLSLLSGWK
jgi:hypothetical protein